MKYRVYDKQHNLLGTVYGKNPEEAIKEAKAFDMKAADYVIAIKNVFDLYVLPEEKGKMRLH